VHPQLVVVVAALDGERGKIERQFGGREPLDGL